MSEYELKLDLHLFGEGGGDGGAAAAGGTGDGFEGAGGQETAPAHTQRRGKANPLSEVRYGKQAEDDEQAGDGQQPEKSDAERKAAFDAFLADPYNKGLYDERVRAQVDRRFKNHGDIEKELEAARPVIKTLMDKHGVSDMTQLQAAIDADDSYWRDKADEAGMTVEQYKRHKALEDQVAQYEQRERAARQQQQMQQDAQRWLSEAEQLKARFPDFDLQRELSDPNTGERFASLLRSGHIDVGTAYQVIHMDDLMSGAIGHAVRTAQEKTVNNIRARGMRPRENGSGGGAAGAIVKKDPSKFTKADRAEIGRRVERGELIEL